MFCIYRLTDFHKPSIYWILFEVMFCVAGTLNVKRNCEAQKRIPISPICFPNIETLSTSHYSGINNKVRYRFNLPKWKKNCFTLLHPFAPLAVYFVYLINIFPFELHKWKYLAYKISLNRFTFSTNQAPKTFESKGLQRKCSINRYVYICIIASVVPLREITILVSFIHVYLSRWTNSLLISANISREVFVGNYWISVCLVYAHLPFEMCERTSTFILRHQSKRRAYLHCYVDNENCLPFQQNVQQFTRTGFLMKWFTFSIQI